MAQNRLAQETSPYLLQHAENPVDWYAWDRESLSRAISEDKPIFLSIGYSSCHWCHVMAHESFESQEIAEFMNEHFVNIKVDREERPDIDDVYQKACQMATGQGGWPLSVFLTPDQKPFHVGTYYPPLDSYGRPGFGSVCRQLAQAWKEKPQDVRSRADEFVRALQKMETAVENHTLAQDSNDIIKNDGTNLESVLGSSVLDEAAVNLYNLGDATYGGFGSAPKFPNSACVSFLLRYAASSGHSSFGKFALRTLGKMARGGIFDQIGGGFHRYSTDARWLVPHFEKMLYDNALIPVNYAEAYQVTRDDFYLDVMKQTLDFVLREMQSPEGGFYSAYDADSQGVEGIYYTWTKKGVQEVLGTGSDADLFCLYYDVTDGGNWEGQTILCNNLPLSSVAFKMGMTENAAKESLGASAARLLDVRRGERVPPGLDDKILVSWNALFVTALAKGYRVSGDPRYLDAARRCVIFLKSKLYDDDSGVLLRTYKEGRARIGGYLEDYAYLACAMLDVFEVSPEPEYLDFAITLGRSITAEFWDSDSSSFYMTGADSHERLIVRPQNRHDLSVPSGNSVAAHVMLRLYHMTGEREFLDVCHNAVRVQARQSAENPFASGYMLNTMHMMIASAGPREITVLNETVDPGVSEMLRLAYLPGDFVVSIRDAKQLAALSGYMFFKGKSFDTACPRVYVCQNSVCSLPLCTPLDIRAALNLSES